MPTAVAGQFVTLQINEFDSTNLVLDMTGGAYATTKDMSELVVSAPDTLVFSSTRRGAIRVATASLPGLHC